MVPHTLGVGAVAPGDLRHLAEAEAQAEAQAEAEAEAEAEENHSHKQPRPRPRPDEGFSVLGGQVYARAGSEVVNLDSKEEEEGEDEEEQDPIEQKSKQFTDCIASGIDSADEDSPRHPAVPADRDRRSRSESVTSSTTGRTSRILDSLDLSVALRSERLRSVSSTLSFTGTSSGTPGRKSKRRDVLSDEQLRSEEVKRLLTFEGEETLLRGSTLSTVLQSRGRIFQNSKGSASTYQLSRVVDGIDSFVSHNWTVPRKTKYFALIYHYFFVRALIGPAILFLILGVLYSTSGILPVVIDKADNYKVGIMARLLTMPCFALTLLGYSDVRAACCCGSGPTVFLDKTCIHQEDASMMRLGISKLGAFIRESKQMLTIFSDEYLRKLWTVYEVASFLTLHPTKDLKMLPTSVPRIVAISLISMYGMLIFGILVKMQMAGSMGQYIATSICAVALVLALRGASREKASISETIAEFSVKKCTCFCEDDRPVIYNNIAVMMRKVLNLPDDMTEDEVLDQFDRLVREELPQALMEQMGKYLIPMNKVFVMAGLFHLPFCFDVIASHVVDDRPLRELLVRIFGSATWGFADTPSILLTTQWLTMRNVKCKTRFRERAWSTACVVLGLATMWARALVNAQLLSMALKSSTGLRLYVAYFLLSFLQACWQGYGWTCCWKKHLEAAVNSDAKEKVDEGEALEDALQQWQQPQGQQQPLEEVIIASDACMKVVEMDTRSMTVLDDPYGDVKSVVVLSATL